MKSGSAIDIFYDLGILKKNPGCPLYYSNKWDLLDSCIEQIFVVIIPLHEIVHKAHQVTKYIDVVMPRYLSSQNLTHASIIVLNDLNQYILIEYGAYDQHREGDYDSKVHYYEGKNGLRFVQLMKSDFDKIVEEEQIYMVECNVKNKIQVVQLIEGTQNIDIERHDWTKSNYNLLGQNCQCFVSKAIMVLEATRKYEKDRNHFESKTHLPFRILNVLEANEQINDDKSGALSLTSKAWQILEKIKQLHRENDNDSKNHQLFLANSNPNNEQLDVL